jgi:hypothetical protein
MTQSLSCVGNHDDTIVDDPEQQRKMQQWQVKTAVSAAVSVKELAFAIMGQKLSDEQKRFLLVKMLTNFVDDVFVSASGSDFFQWFENKIMERFGHSTSGKILLCLGMEFLRTRDMKFLTVSQCWYVKEEVDSVGFDKERGSKTPIDPKEKLSLAVRMEVVDSMMQKENRKETLDLSFANLSIMNDLNVLCSTYSDLDFAGCIDTCSIPDCVVLMDGGLTT